MRLRKIHIPNSLQANSKNRETDDEGDKSPTKTQGVLISIPTKPSTKKRIFKKVHNFKFPEIRGLYKSIFIDIKKFSTCSLEYLHFFVK